MPSAVDHHAYKQAFASKILYGELRRHRVDVGMCAMQTYGYQPVNCRALEHNGWHDSLRLYW